MFIDHKYRIVLVPDVASAYLEAVHPPYFLGNTCGHIKISFCFLLLYFLIPVMKRGVLPAVFLEHPLYRLSRLSAIAFRLGADHV